MNEAIIEQIAKANKKHTLRGFWRRIVTGLACIVVFCTVYALILPAITMKTEVFCGVEEHIHTNDCFRQIQSGEPTCGIAEEMAHVHGESCYAEPEATSEPVLHVHTDSCFQQVQGDLNCGLEETQGHQHGSACYIPGENLICTKTENHQHVDTCFTYLLICQDETDEHEHAPECYSTEASQVCELEEMHVHTDSCYESILVCELPEVEGHTHAEGCYLWHEETICEMEEGQPEPTEVPDPVLICTIPAVQTHVHSDSCYESQFDGCSEDHVHTTDCAGWQLICELEVHEHQLICYSDPTADLETPDVWETTFSDVVLTGDTRKDLLAIAQTQLGYHESTRNYTVDADGKLHGYTRYGAWYGYPHGEWCAMFVSFCLNYADIHEIPYYAGVSPWVEKLTELNRYRKAGEYAPIPGDLIFFDWKQDGYTDHIGIVTELIPATETQKAQIKVLEGNAAAQVKYVYYNQDSAKICGYAVLPERLTEDEVAQLETVRNLIDQLPDQSEIDQALAEYDAKLEYEQRDLWYAELTAQVKEVYRQYLALSDLQLQHLDNAQQLLDLEEIWSAPDPSRVSDMIAMIDQLPSCDEVDATLLAYEEAEDMEGYEAYFANVYWQCRDAYNVYQALTESEQALVSNIDRLMDLEWLWSVTLYAEDLSRITYNPEYETDTYHKKWEDNSKWATQYGPNDDIVNVNIPVPDEYAIDGLVIGAKSADSVEVYGFTPLITSAPENPDAIIEGTSFKWETLQSTGMDCTLSANLLLPYEQADKEALVGTSSDRTYDIYAIYRNIGTYNGKSIDLKMTLVDYENYVKTDTKGNNTIQNGVLGFWTKDIRIDQPTYGLRLPGISVCGISWVRIQYKFLESGTNKEIKVKGSTSFYDIDFSQAIHVWADETKLKGIYVTDVNSNVPNLDTVNGLPNMAAQREYFTSWTADDCVLKISKQPPNDRKGVVVFSSHGNDNGLNSEQYGDTKHAFTMTFDCENITCVYSFDKGLNARNANGNGYNRNANGGIIHSGVPVYTGSLEIKKEVAATNISPDQEFQFQIEFFKKANSAVLDDHLDGTFGNVTLVDGVGTFTLKDGESIKISGIPIRANGTPYKITELTTDGYVVSTSMSQVPSGGAVETNGPLVQNYYTNILQADEVMDQNQIVTFTNRHNSIFVTKELTATADVDMVGSPEFSFQIMKAGTTSPFFGYGNDSDDGSGREYYVYDIQTGKLVGENPRSTEAYGIFKIKAGQRAEFRGISDYSGQYYIREVLDVQFAAQYDGIYIDGVQIADYDTLFNGKYVGYSSEVKDFSEAGTTFAFRNHVNAAKLSYLTITKMVKGVSSDVEKTLEFDMMVELNGVLNSTEGWKPIPVGTPYTLYRTDVFMENGQKVKIADNPDRVVTREGIVTVPGGATAEIDNMIPGTTYRAYETSESAEGYTVSYGEFWGKPWITAYSDRVEGTIPVYNESNLATAHVCMTVTNALPSTNVQFSVFKQMANGNLDSNAHSVSFIANCIEAKDKNGDSVDALLGTYSQAGATIGDDQWKEIKFVIGYDYYKQFDGHVATDKWPVRLIYEITEVPSDDNAYTHDDTKYYVAVDVNLKRELTGWKFTTTLVTPVPVYEGNIVPESGYATYTNYLLGDLTLEKVVVGGVNAQANGSFDFNVQIRTDAGTPYQNTTLQVVKNGTAAGTVTTNSNGIVTFTGVKHGDRIVLQGIPLGYVWRITETNPAGYIVSWESSDNSGISNVADGRITADGMRVLFTNTTSYELPQTGSIGTTSYTMGGLLLTAAAVILLYMQKRRRREGR